MLKVTSCVLALTAVVLLSGCTAWGYVDTNNGYGYHHHHHHYYYPNPYTGGQVVPS